MPRAARSRGPSWGVEVADPERRWSRRLAPGGGRSGSGRGPLLSRSRGRASGARAAGPPPLPAGDPGPPFALSGRLAPRPSRARGCAPGMRAPAAARGTPRRRPPLRASPRVAAAPHCVPRARVVAGGVWFSAGVFVGWRRAAPSAGPGPGPRRERGARGTCGGEGRVCRVGGKGPAVGGDRRAWTPPRPRPLLPSLPRPAPLAAVPPPGVVVRRRVPRPGPAQTPVPPPPLRLPTPAGLPPVPPARAPACPPAVPPAVPRAHPYLPRPPSPSRLSPLPRALASLSLPPSLAEGLEEGGLLVRCGEGGSSVVGGWRLGRCVWGFASLGVGRRTGRVAERGLFPGPAFRSSRRPSALASRGSSWRARARVPPRRDLRSDVATR